MVHRFLNRPSRAAVRAPAALAVALVGALALPAPAAMAYCRTTTCAIRNPPSSCTRDFNTGCWTSGIPLFWTQQCLSYAVNVAGSPRLGLDYTAALAVVESGFAHWPNASCSDGSPSLAFMSRPGLTCDRVEYNPTGPNANAILFRDSGWTHEATALALTTVAFNVKTGQILDADMEINTSAIAPIDLEFVVTHESGHFVGLDHSSEISAVMFFQYSGPSTPTGDAPLTSDDIQAICTAYPPTRDAPVCSFEPDKGFATDCGGDVIAACAVAPASPSDGGNGIGIGVAVTVGAVLAHRLRARRRRRRQASQDGSRPRSA
jgi:hypothetical protein